MFQTRNKIREFRGPAVGRQLAFLWEEVELFWFYARESRVYGWENIIYAQLNIFVLEMINFAAVRLHSAAILNKAISLACATPKTQEQQRMFFASREKLQSLKGRLRGREAFFI